MKKIVYFVLFFSLLGFFGYKYLYKQHRDIASEEVFLSQKSTSFISEVSKKGALPKEYIDKTIQISGVITGFSENEITLDKKLFFLFDHNVKIKTIGKHVSIKARCLGYDDLLEEVKFDQAILLNQ